MAKPHVRVVNMIPVSMSGETNQDSEPQLAVNHENVREMVATTFTPDPGGGPNGPVFASFDGGNTWTLDLVVPGGEPNDQSVRFGGGSTLYAGILRGDVFLRLNVLRSAPYSTSSVMQTVVQRDTIDQPYVAAIEADGKDRVFVGNNDAGGGPYTGSIEHSADARTGAPPAGFGQTAVESRLTIRSSPSIRPAPHRDGTVYAAYFSWRQASPVKADIVVVRDDAFGTGGSPFGALIDPGDGKAGVRVAQSVQVPWTGPWTRIGNQRVGSSLTTAVDPRHSRVAYVTWGDGPAGASSQTLRVRRTTDRGATWSGDLVTVDNATNPSLAVTRDGKVGFMYQRVVTAGAQQRWETRLQVTQHAWAKPAHDILLATTPVDGATFAFDPYIGDYADLQAVGEAFYGIFSAHNVPDLANFPHGVHYQRKADFGTHQLLAVNGITPVANSIDPFFFHVAWRDEEEGEDDRERGFERESLEVRGLTYERLTIRHLKFRSSGTARERDDDDERESRRGGRALIRLGEHIEALGHRLADRAEASEDDDEEERET